MVLVSLIAGERTEQSLTDGVYLIGRSEASKIRLDFPDVSDRHAMLKISGKEVTLEDLGSANGTYINGESVVGVQRLDDSKVVQIGGSLLRVFDNTAVNEEIVEEASLPDSDADRELRRSVQEQIEHELLKRMDLKRMSANGSVELSELEETARNRIRQIIDEVVENNRLPDGIDPTRLEEDVFNEALRLGPLEDLLDDDNVSEIMVNGPSQVYVERNGKLVLTDCQFIDESSVLAIIERIVSPLGRRIDESQPYVDARLKDGSRVNAIIPPLSLTGPVITIRKFSKRALSSEDFIRFGTWTADVAEYMRLAVLMRKNIVVAGGTGSGKTTLLNLLSGYIPDSERIVTIEDAAELRLQQSHVVRLEARPANIEGKGAITIRDLVRNALRMRPDRIIVGECRGGEALDMLQAMNTGHDGSLTTVHANSPRDVISRLETMVLMSGMDLPSRAIREQIASAVDLVIHESRLSDGSRKVVAISEIMGIEGNQIIMQPVFEFKEQGLTPEGKISGKLCPTGAIPTWLDQLKMRGLSLNMSMFNAQ